MLQRWHNLFVLDFRRQILLEILHFFVNLVGYFDLFLFKHLVGENQAVRRSSEDDFACVRIKTLLDRLLIWLFEQAHL